MEISEVLDARDWWPRAQAQQREAHARTAGRLYRQSRGLKNPIEDFLWEYYPLRPSWLARWHPGFDSLGRSIALAEPEPSMGADYELAHQYWAELGARRWHEILEAQGGRAVAVTDQYAQDRAHGINFLYQLLRTVQDREPSFGCLGWHEWAMVYRTRSRSRGDGDGASVEESAASPFTRHDLPLRLGADRTNEIVEAAHIRCTHFDAYRFFTPAAAPLNHVQPAYERVLELDQPGCIHVNMDLLRACIQLGPLVPGELMLACFDLALKARRVDMAASPYDCSSIGLKPITIETAQGKAQYIAVQQQISREARPLRDQLLALLAPLAAAAAASSA